jgi:hypothetical protein
LKRLGLVTTGLFLLELGAASAQQLEPSAHTPLPVDLNFVSLPYTYQTASVITDPPLPVRIS